MTSSRPVALTLLACPLCSGTYLSDHPPGKYPCPVCWFKLIRAMAHDKESEENQEWD